MRIRAGGNAVGQRGAASEAGDGAAEDVQSIAEAYTNSDANTGADAIANADVAANRFADADPAPACAAVSRRDRARARRAVLLRRDRLRR